MIGSLAHACPWPTWTARCPALPPRASQGRVGYKSDPDCKLTWPTLKISAVYFHGYGGVRNSCSAASGTLTVMLGSGWRTDTGLAVGAPLASLQSIYPSATQEGLLWGLINYHTPWESVIHVLAAEVNSRYVASLSVAGPKSWDE